MFAVIQAGAAYANGPGSTGREGYLQLPIDPIDKSSTVAAGDEDADALDGQQFERLLILRHIGGRGLVFAFAITDADDLDLIVCRNLIDDIQKTLIIGLGRLIIQQLRIRSQTRDHLKVKGSLAFSRASR